MIEYSLSVGAILRGRSLHRFPRRASAGAARAPRSAILRSLGERMEATKRCPFCGKEILAVTVKCKHCGFDLTGDAPAKSDNSAAKGKDS